MEPWPGGGTFRGLSQGKAMLPECHPFLGTPSLEPHTSGVLLPLEHPQRLPVNCPAAFRGEALAPVGYSWESADIERVVDLNPALYWDHGFLRHWSSQRVFPGLFQ